MRIFSARWTIGAPFALAAILAMGFGSIPLCAQEPVALLHPSTNVVITVKMKEMLTKPVVKTYVLKQIQSMLEGDAELQKSLKAIGMDPMKDLDTLTLGVYVNKNDLTKPTLSGVLDGKFDAAKLMAAATAEKMNTFPVGGKTVVELPNKSDGSVLYAAVVGERRIFFTTEKAAIEAVLSTAATGPDKALAALVTKTNGSTAVMTVVTGKDLLSTLPLNPPDDKKDLVKSLENMTIEVKAENDVAVTVAFDTSDVASAAQLVDQLEPQIQSAVLIASFAKGQLTGPYKAFAPLFDASKTLKIESKDKKAVITATVKASIIEAMMKDK